MAEGNQSHPADSGARHRAVEIALAVSDASLRRTLEETLRRNRLGHNLNALGNGDELLQWLEGDGGQARLPNLILASLDEADIGYRALFRCLKTNARLRPIPVIVFVHRGERTLAKELYRLGASSVIQLPLYFSDLVEILRVMEHYWDNVAHLSDPDT